MDFGFRYRHGVHAMQASFVDPAAVEAWDAWFRWREGNELRDVTIDATWSRVTRALCALAPTEPAQHEQQVGEAISSWRLLPDARVLAGAGQRHFVWPSDALYVGINLARFVSLPFTAKASFQRPALAETARLALRLIDDMYLGADGTAGAPPRLGILGLADALAMLGVDYASEAGAQTAAQIAREFAAASLEATCELAAERGNRASDAVIKAALHRAERLELAPAQRQRLCRHGLRLAPLTAIAAQPRLALVANNVADAISPLRGEKVPYQIVGANGQRRVTASGFAITLWRQLGARADETAFPFSTAATAGDAGVARIRAAMTPWFDQIADALPQPADSQTVAG
jgi:ribonucleoside-diphosphate reductase alpha chain